jgi:sugar phosphate isomerase/epimerase
MKKQFAKITLEVCADEVQVHHPNGLDKEPAERSLSPLELLEEALSYDLDLTILSIESEPLDLVPQTIERHLEDFIRIGKEAPKVMTGTDIVGGEQRLQNIQNLYDEAAKVATTAAHSMHAGVDISGKDNK